MDWLVPALVATLIWNCVLFLTFLIVYVHEKKSYLRIWTFAWALFFLRAIFILVNVYFPHISFVVIVYLCRLFSGFFLILGTYIFLGRELSKLWKYVFVLVGGWTIVSIILGMSFPCFAFPVTFLLSIVHIMAGVVLIKNTKLTGYGKILLGWIFILWGIHYLDFAFLRNVVWFAPWGFMISSTLGLIAAVTIIIVYYEFVEDMLRKSEEKLNQKIRDLERFAKVAVGREKKMIELKKQNKELRLKSGK